MQYNSFIPNSQAQFKKNFSSSCLPITLQLEYLRRRTEVFMTIQNSINTLTCNYLDQSIEQFIKIYSIRPSMIIRAPGRVNMIGEHTDYHDLTVLPASINRTVFILLSPRKDNLVKIKTFQEILPERNFQLLTPIQPDNQGDWANYVKAGSQTVLNHFTEEIKGYNGLVYGTIPQGGGLSSSSALVVASALALLYRNNISFNKEILAKDLAIGEQYVGTAGGGMDQTASLCGKKGHLIKIDFNPLQVQPIPFPENYSIIITNSLVTAEKSGPAKNIYNLRSLEGRFGTALISNTLYKRTGKSISRLGDLRKPIFQKINIQSLIEEIFHEHSYSADEIKKQLTSEQLQKLLTMKNGNSFPFLEYSYKLKQRIRHVISEWERVTKSSELLLSGKISDFGNLMDQSHISCRDDMEISCPELNELVHIQKHHGALGARLTGAGFGGCTVSLISSDQSESFIEKVKKDYYIDYLSKHQPNLIDHSNKINIFQVFPSNGAGIMEV